MDEASQVCFPKFNYSSSSNTRLDLKPSELNKIRANVLSYFRKCFYIHVLCT